MIIKKTGLAQSVCFVMVNLWLVHPVFGVDIITVNNGSLNTINSNGNIGNYVTVPHPSGNAFDSFGNFYVSNWGYGTISKIAPDMNVTTISVPWTPHPQGIAFDRYGNLFYTSAEGIIGMISPSGACSQFSSYNSGSPSGLAFDSSGNLWVANWYNNKLSMIDPSGNIQPITTDGNAIFSIAFDSDGNLYATELWNQKITKRTPDGTTTDFLTSGLAEPNGIAYDKIGNCLYVSNGQGGSIIKVSLTGQITPFATGLSNSNWFSIVPVPEPSTYIYGFNALILLILKNRLKLHLFRNSEFREFNRRQQRLI